MIMKYALNRNIMQFSRMSTAKSKKWRLKKEVAEALIQAHRSEKANARYNERYTYTDGVIVLFRPDKYERRIDECNESKSACFKG